MLFFLFFLSLSFLCLMHSIQLLMCWRLTAEGCSSFHQSGAAFALQTLMQNDPAYRRAVSALR
jgi:hypothetical protein